MSCHNLIRYFVDHVLNELICYQMNKPAILKEIHLPVLPLHGEGSSKSRLLAASFKPHPTYGSELSPFSTKTVLVVVGLSV